MRRTWAVYSQLFPKYHWIELAKDWLMLCTNQSLFLDGRKTLLMKQRTEDSVQLVMEVWEISKHFQHAILLSCCACWELEQTESIAYWNPNWLYFPTDVALITSWLMVDFKAIFSRRSLRALPPLKDFTWFLHTVLWRARKKKSWGDAGTVGRHKGKNLCSQVCTARQDF